MYTYNMLTRSNFFVTAVSGDDTETAAAVVAELQKPCDTAVTLRPSNSNFDNGEGNAAYYRLYNYVYYYNINELFAKSIPIISSIGVFAFTFVWKRAITIWCMILSTRVVTQCCCYCCTEEERTTRRISYLKATAWGDHMSVDDFTTTESESEPSSIVVTQPK